MEPATPPSMERADAMVRYNEALIAPLVAELAETRVQVLAQADRIADLARENGTPTERLTYVERERDGLTVELAAEREARSALEARTASESVEPATAPSSVTVDPLAPLWRRMWPVLATLLALILTIAVVALLAWPR